MMMRKLFLALLIAVGGGSIAHAQPSVREYTNTAFSYGEKVTYKIRYNMYFNINVGEITFEIGKKPQVVAGHDCFHVTALGTTYSFYDKIFKVRDRYETFIETKSILPMVFIRNVQEGGYKLNEYVLFNQSRSMAKSQRRIQSVPQFTQDMLSALYYARTLDFDNAKPGQDYQMHAFMDDSTYKVGVRYLKRETIKTEMGKFRCIKLQPMLIADRVFKNGESMTLWVTDDANRMPVRVESSIAVGAIRADLTAYGGLRNPMKSKL